MTIFNAETSLEVLERSLGPANAMFYVLLVVTSKCTVLDIMFYITYNFFSHI